MIPAVVQDTFAKGLQALGVEKVSPRERAMIAGLAATAAVFAVVAAFDWSESVRVQATDARAERESLEHAAARQTPGLTDQVILRQVNKVRQMAFADSTIPIARAAAQVQLERMANKAKVNDVRVAPDGDPAGEGAIRTQVYAVRGKFDWPSFLALIKAISDAPQSIGVLGISVDSGMASSFELRVRVPLVMDKTG